MAKDYPSCPSLIIDPHEWFRTALPSTTFDAMSFELAIREALDNGFGRCGLFEVRCHPSCATVSNDGYLLVLDSPDKLADLIGMLSERKAIFLAYPEADFMRGWLGDPPAKKK